MVLMEERVNTCVMLYIIVLPMVEDFDITRHVAHRGPESLVNGSAPTPISLAGSCFGRDQVR